MGLSPLGEQRIRELSLRCAGMLTSPCCGFAPSPHPSNTNAVLRPSGRIVAAMHAHTNYYVISAVTIFSSTSSLLSISLSTYPLISCSSERNCASGPSAIITNCRLLRGNISDRRTSRGTAHPPHLLDRLLHLLVVSYHRSILTTPTRNGSSPRTCWKNSTNSPYSTAPSRAANRSKSYRRFTDLCGIAMY